MSYLTMITLFVEENNTLTPHFYNKIINNLQFHRLTCSCGHSGCLSVHGYYNRFIKAPSGRLCFRICRVKCQCCGPFYYRKLAGNIPDSKTVKHLLEDLDILGFGKTKFVMDRGFYSEDNINGLYRGHVKFLVGTKLSLKFIKKNLDDVYDDIRMFNNYDDSIATYGYTVSTEWDYTQERPYKGDVIKDKRRMYIHYYYSIEKGADDEQAFDKRIANLHKELLEDKLVESHKKAYEQFFEVKTTPKRGRHVNYKEDAKRKQGNTLVILLLSQTKKWMHLLHCTFTE